MYQLEYWNYLLTSNVIRAFLTLKWKVQIRVDFKCKTILLLICKLIYFNTYWIKNNWNITKKWFSNTRRYFLYMLFLKDILFLNITFIIRKYRVIVINIIYHSEAYLSASEIIISGKSIDHISRRYMLSSIKFIALLFL